MESEPAAFKLQTSAHTPPVPCFRGRCVLRFRRSALSDFRRHDPALPGYVQVRHGQSEAGVSRHAVLPGADEERGAPRQQRRLIHPLHGDRRVRFRHQDRPWQGNLREFDDDNDNNKALLPYSTCKNYMINWNVVWR